MPDPGARDTGGPRGAEADATATATAVTDATAAVDATERSRERREQRREARRNEIVRAAVDVFAERGLEGTTLDAVAVQVNLSKGSLYHYFRSKEELFGLLIRHAIEAQEEAVARSARGREGAADRLRAFCLAHLHSVADRPEGRLAARVALAGMTDELVRAPLRAYTQKLDAILAEGIAEGAFRRVDVTVTRYSILAALNSVTLWYSPGGARSLDEIGTEICDLILTGLSRFPTKG